ncbi:MAG TPA: ribbon-helix-helix protein, CopG family [Desulfuromonadaceae bacterium]|jgi:antitoxin component of RelBE/YafQ-DinJ toxin-antitoxin module
MRDKLYTFTKPTIVSARISDKQLESVERLMEETNMTASQIMRRAFQMMIERFNETGRLHSSEQS